MTTVVVDENVQILTVTEQGPTGPMGPQGIQGVAGADGADGMNPTINAVAPIVKTGNEIAEISILPATTFSPGSMSAVDKVKLDSIESATVSLTNKTLVAPVITPATSAAPAVNGNMVFELTSNTFLTVKVKGSDGVIRSVVLTLS